ncbi:MAG: hypothetical protein ABSA14_12090 [Acidimicrobiales bacterium]
MARAPPGALGYGNPAGDPELRTATAGYLARARGLRRARLCATLAERY